ncbi:unnamed protein product [Hymenolepis diminuta]|uniref:Uncharacterized protein n=1 Tax=Hymenolepis diminuta TaxID=6216 RepID=A0A564XWD7_HYMDI|nr:unnamed protein product [Hymenolepis diminuta]
MAWHDGRKLRDFNAWYLTKHLNCLKKQQYIRNALHQDLGYKSCAFLGEVSLRVNADADEDANVETLQTITDKLPWIDTGRLLCVF